MKAPAGVTCAALLALSACDDSQVWHAPDLQLDRMQTQPRVDPFDPAMSSAPPFTVPVERRLDRTRPQVTTALVEEGRRVFDRTCATCHGVRGDGESVVATKMTLRAPPSLLSADIRALTDEQVHEIVDRGYGLMPAYEGVLSFSEAWAAVSYVHALQLAQGVPLTALPAELRAELERKAP